MRKSTAVFNPCRCCGAAACGQSGVSRRNFLAGAGASTLLAPKAAVAQTKSGDPNRQQPIRKALKVQPVLMYQIPKRVPERSWRSWGGIQTAADLSGEQERIRRELAGMGTPFPMEVLPLASVQTAEEGAKVAQGDHDVLLMYAAGNNVNVAEALTAPGKQTLMFVRHRSGPVYLWYEIAHPRYLRKTVDEYGQPGMDSQDVVVDSHAEVLWRLRSFYGLKNTLGKTIVAVGGPSGWGTGGRKAAELARTIWKLDIRTVGYPELGERIKKARQNDALVRQLNGKAEQYLKQKGVTLRTARESVTNSFVLTEVFRDLLDEAQTDAITINQCMGTIMPLSQTSACLPLSILNDEGYMAFCESDFVVIPSGILMHYISGKPTFLNDPTYPHDGVVTMAHCTAPRKMDGEHDEPVQILTHFESDYGAAPKVDMRKGQRVTVLDPDFGGRDWVGFEGEIAENPFLPICRSQVDATIDGNCDLLAREMKGFHWMLTYGGQLKEAAYALKKNGIKLTRV